jgi:LemA protein
MPPLLTIACLVVPALLLVGGVLLQNRLAAGLVAVRTALAGIEVQLQRRHDLVPRLVETAKAAMAHEREVLERAVEARERAGRALAESDPAALAAAEGGLEAAIAAVFLRVEAYPALRTSENMLALQEELVTSENRVAFARHAYNDAAMQFNTRLRTFPSNLLAAMLRYREAALLQWADANLAASPAAAFPPAGEISTASGPRPVEP